MTPFPPLSLSFHYRPLFAGSENILPDETNHLGNNEMKLKSKWFWSKDLHGSAAFQSILPCFWGGIPGRHSRLPFYSVRIHLNSTNTLCQKNHIINLILGTIPVCILMAVLTALNWIINLEFILQQNIENKRLHETIKKKLEHFWINMRQMYQMSS